MDGLVTWLTHHNHKGAPRPADAARRARTPLRTCGMGKHRRATNAVITFDDAKRKEFLTGFRKRKQERRKTRRDFTLAKAKTVESKGKGLDLDLKLDLDLELELDLDLEGKARAGHSGKARLGPSG